MNRKEQVLAVVNGERPNIIPTIAEAVMDITVADSLGLKSTGNPGKDQINLAEFLKKNDVVVGADIRNTIILKDTDRFVYEYETGAVWEIRSEPNFCRDAIKYPVNSPSEVQNLKFPDPHNQERYELIEQMMREFSKTDFLIQGCLGGIWSGTYYYCTSFENALMWMISEPEVIQQIIDKIGNYVLGSAEELLKRGVDSIFIYDDLGTANSLIFSPELYRRFIKPWHKKIADLCHSYSKLFHLHSHGHIQDIMDDLIDVGVDILNPIGPSDNNDLRYFKEKWGNKITFLGGISTKIAQMSEEQIESHIAEVMEIGTKGSRFMPRTESGIPKMSPKKVRFFVDTLYEYRKQYGQI